MDQQIQERGPQTQEQEQLQKTQAPQPERERLTAAAQLLQSALDGVSLLEMPPGRLAELAGLLGNQGMQELLDRQGLPLQEEAFVLPPPVQTAPLAVPGDLVPEAVSPPALTAGAWRGRAFDPAGLAQGGGAAYDTAL